MCVPNTMRVSVTQPFINTEHQKHAINPLHTPETPLLSDRLNGIAFFFFCSFWFVLFVCWCTELLKFPLALWIWRLQNIPLLCFAHLEGIFKAVIICKSQEWVLPLPSTFSYFKLSSHCWSSAGKGHECQLIHSDKRLSCMSPGQSNDCWHPCPTYVILCIIFNPEFTSTTQRRKLRELRWGGSQVHTQ